MQLSLVAQLLGQGGGGRHVCAPLRLASMELQHQSGAACYGTEQGTGTELLRSQRLSLVLQAQRGVKLQLQRFGSRWHWRQCQHSRVRLYAGVLGCPDGVGRTISIQPLHFSEFSAAARSGQAVVQGTLPSYDDQWQLLQRMANQHHMKLQCVPGLQHRVLFCSRCASDGGGRLHHVGVGDGTEALQLVRLWWRGFKNERIGAGALQGATAAAGLACHAGQMAQRRTKLATQQRAGVRRQLQFVVHPGMKAVTRNRQDSTCQGKLWQALVHAEPRRALSCNSLRCFLPSQSTAVGSACSSMSARAQRSAALQAASARAVLTSLSAS